MRKKSSARINTSSILYKGIKSAPQSLNVMSQAVLPAWQLCFFKKQQRNLRLLSAGKLCHQKSVPKESGLVGINVHNAQSPGLGCSLAQSLQVIPEEVPPVTGMPSILVVCYFQRFLPLSLGFFFFFTTAEGKVSVR